MKSPLHLSSTRRHHAATLALLMLLSQAGTATGAQAPADPPQAVQGAQSAAPEPDAPEPELAEVQVSGKKEVRAVPREGSAESGYRSGAAALGPLGNLPLQDTPYSVSVTSGEIIENRGAHTVFDALQNNPAVANLMVPNSYSSLSRVMIRGFTAADQSELRDGLVDRSFSYPPLENVERIEVMNGFSSFLYGFSSPGGTLNYVSKQPTPTLLADLSTGVYGGGIGYLQGDFGGAIPYTGGKLTSRFNVYREDGDTYIDHGDQRRTFLSGALDFRLLPGTVLKGDVSYQDYTVHGLQTYFDAPAGNWATSGIHPPAASQFDPTKQYGQSFTFNKSEKTVLGLGLDSKLSDVFTLRTAYRYGHMWRQYDYVDATLAGNAGNYTEKFTTTPRQNESTNSIYALVDASFDTSFIHHDVTFGYTGAEYYYDRGVDISQSLGASSISSPTAVQDPAIALGPTTNYQRQYLDNYLIGDRVRFTSYLSALFGVNYAHLKQTASGINTVLSTSNFSQGKFSPSFALMYKPVSFFSTYASYMQGLIAGGSTSSANARNANQVLSPSVSEQYEVGAKASLGGMDLTAALFRIDKVNEYLDPSDSIYKQDGREVHQGVEVAGSGKLTERLTAVGGFTLMDAEVTRARNNTALEGKTPINVPEAQAKLYLEYEIPLVPHLTATAGGNYFGRRPVDALNSAYFPEAITCDAGLRYQPALYGHKTSFILNVTNLLDKRYWSYYRSGDGLLLGEPRLVAFSAKLSW